MIKSLIALLTILFFLILSGFSYGVFTTAPLVQLMETTTAISPAVPAATTSLYLAAATSLGACCIIGGGINYCKNAHDNGWTNPCGYSRHGYEESFYEENPKTCANCCKALFKPAFCKYTYGDCPNIDLRNPVRNDLFHVSYQ